MMKVYNFNAGPSMLPEEVMQDMQAELLDWHGTGMSIMELGHRGAEFQMVAEQAEADLRELMHIPKDYHVLFLTGGASAQFAMVPLNLMSQRKKADYIDTGIWSKKAIDEARRYGTVNVAGSSKVEHNLVCLPHQADLQFSADADYVHYTPNETIDGLEFHWVPETNGVPLVADMSSNILSRPIDVTKFGLIYAGAQKNMGQAGITVVIIHDSLLRDSVFLTPTLYSYKLHAENHSFYNTPPTFAWYVCGLVLAWLKRKGGVEAMYQINQRKASKLYDFIDTSNHFYFNRVRKEDRSLMNIPFSMHDEKLDKIFLEEATNAGLTNLKGHRIVGGLRASIYNAMPEAGVDALIAFMRDFAKKHG